MCTASGPADLDTPGLARKIAGSYIARPKDLCVRMRGSVHVKNLSLNRNIR